VAAAHTLTAVWSNERCKVTVTDIAIDSLQADTAMLTIMIETIAHCRCCIKQSMKQPIQLPIRHIANFYILQFYSHVLSCTLTYFCVNMYAYLFSCSFTRQSTCAGSFFSIRSCCKL